MEFTNVEILTKTPPPRKDIFYLADHFVLRSDGKFHPRYYPVEGRVFNNVYNNIFEAARDIYPKGMLPSDSKLYAIVNGEVLEGKTKKVKPFEALEDFVDYIQKTEKKEGATVISFGRRDFEALANVIEMQDSRWGISERFYNGVLYRVHVYGSPPPLPAATRK